jgi:hypothetical protein
MTETKGDHPAFGSSDAWGMTIREYFSAAALQGLLANGDYAGCEYDAVVKADALIAALNGQEPEGNP